MIREKNNKQAETVGVEYTPSVLFGYVANLIEEARQRVASEYNSAHTLLCWHIGKRIDKEVLQAERAEYGEVIVINLSKKLTKSYGRGYGRSVLFRMIKFPKLFPDEEIVATLSRQLSWSHFVIICSIEAEVKRNFYTEMARVQRWSIRVLRAQLKSMLYERTSLSKKPESVIVDAIE